MIQIQVFTFNPLQENTYLLYDETGECLIIDPGCHDRSEQEALADFVQDNQLTVVQLLNTHGHIDHVFGNAYVKKKFGVPLAIHQRDLATLQAVVVYAPVYGLPWYEPTTPDRFIETGEIIRWGNSTLEVLFVPGHAPGHVAFVNREQRLCMGGDVLFKRSIGRTDLPGGDYATLLHSIRTQLFPLSNDCVVYPGHGEPTTIGEEKRYNPFCAEV